MKKILITGANGLLGRALCEILANEEHKVYALVRKPLLQALENVHYLEINLEHNLADVSLPNDVDIIYHLAQSQHFREFPEKANDIFNVNVKSTQNLLDYALKTGVKQFIYASSGGVYGFGKQAFSEELNVPIHNDLGYYLGTKMMGELLVRNYSQLLLTQIARPFFIYGPRQHKNMLIPRLIENVKQGNPIQLKEGNGLEINPIYVNDAARAFKLIADSELSGIFNVAGTEKVSLKYIAEAIGSLLDKKPNFEMVEGAQGHLIGDISRLQEIGFQNEYSLFEGLKTMIIA